MTNGDKIRQMTDEELTELLRKGCICDICEFGDKEIICPADCGRGILIWMLQETE